MEIEKKTVTAKTRKLKGTWTVGVQPAPTIEELEEEFREVYDRWCWETGSDKDKKRLDELLEEIKFQKKHDEIINEAMEYAANEMRKGIDKELLKDLMKKAKT